MKWISWILFSFLIFSCQEEVKHSEKSKVDKKDTLEVPTVEMVTTAMHIMTYSSYEDPFYEDTLEMELPISKFKIPESDSLFTVEYLFSASYPQSKLEEHNNFNKLIREKVEKYFKEHLLLTDDENTYSCFYVNAEYKATDFEYKNDYVGILFTEQDYFAGAAHFNHGYHSFHFDFKKNKEIKLTDILIFKKGEAQKFSDAFNPDPTTTIHDVIIDEEDFLADRPFLANYGELYLYFSDGEKGPGMTRVIIPYSKFKGYVNPNYKYLFED